MLGTDEKHEGVWFFHQTAIMESLHAGLLLEC